MCTVTAVRHPADSASHQAASLRIVVNRDEQRTRPGSEGPFRFQTGPLTSVMPIDPLSGGTWMGCNNAGLAVVLLNMSPGRSPHTPRPGDKSRGSIVPTLLAAASIAEATDLAATLPAHAFPPFRLLLATTEHYALLSACRDLVRPFDSGRLDRPLMLTSSGLGDDIVLPHRNELFSQLLKSSTSPSHACVTADAQDRFHRTTHSQRPELGVLMHRADARTVSITTLTLDGRAATMVHSRVTDLGELPSESVQITLLAPAQEFSR